MLACGHEGPPFGSPLCAHLQTCREPWINYVRWYTGSNLEADLLCVPCAEERAKGLPIEPVRVCEECFEYATTEAGDVVGIRGQSGIRSRPERFDGALTTSRLPAEFRTILDIAPVGLTGRSAWLLLAEGGVLVRFDADTGEWSRAASVNVPGEPDHQPWNNRALRQRLHASRHGDFAAVVNDYGRYGQVLDLGSGKITIELDGGDYHANTVPFSFAFAELQGRVVAVHRTAWNRLDVSDPRTGELLTDRVSPIYERGKERSDHYLDYFHGALYVSPGGNYLVDDGWVWQPTGVPSTWNLHHWVSHNVWESENGGTKKDLCGRDYYWDQAIAWIDDKRVAIGGIGEDDQLMVAGARIFDTGLPGCPARELLAFAGPAGTFFSDGYRLYSAGEDGLSRWDLDVGARTGHLLDFRPTHHHFGARELAQVTDGSLVRWSIPRGT